MTVTLEDIQAALPPREYARLYPEKMAASPSAPDYLDPYENAANFIAKVLMGAASRDPIAFKQALNSYRNDPFGDEVEKQMTAEERYVTLGDPHWGATGHQWGWAVNLVAHFLEQDPVPNPAIWTIVIGGSPNA